jgi:hypothetical protein
MIGRSAAYPVPTASRRRAVLRGFRPIDPICAEIAGRGTPNIEDDRARRDDPAARGRQSVGAEKRKPRL